MASLGIIGTSARTGVGGSTSYVHNVLSGFVGGVSYGTISRNGGFANPRATTAITLVRFATAVTPTSQATLTATFPTAPTQGHTLIAIASSDATVAMTSTGWTLVGSVINFTGHYMWTKDAGASESTTVTITLGATTTAELFIAELSGTSAAALDVSATNDPGANASTIASGTTGATGQADEITFASFSWNDSTGTGATLSSVANTSGVVAPKPAILANLRGTDPTSMDTMLGVAYRFTPAAGAQSATATLSNTGGRPTGIIATFLASAGGAAVTLGAAPESDVAVALGLQFVKTLTLAPESDAAQALTTFKPLTLTPAAESSAALALSFAKLVTLAPAAEGDEAQALARFAAATLAPAIESDEARPLDFDHDTGTDLTPAAETDTAQPLGLTWIKTLMPAAEDDFGVSLQYAGTGVGGGGVHTQRVRHFAGVRQEDAEGVQSNA